MNWFGPSGKRLCSITRSLKPSRNLFMNGREICRAITGRNWQ